MTDSADPLDGWYSKDVAETSHGPATADLYGKLFFHIRSTLRSFLARLSDSPVTFQIFQVDVAELPRHLEPGSFGRIEVRVIPCIRHHLGGLRISCPMTPTCNDWQLAATDFHF